MGTDTTNQGALHEAWSQTTTPYSQIKDSAGLGTGQYDFAVASLKPEFDDNGLYRIVGEFTIVAPTGFQFPFTRSLYVGTHKDKEAKLPETRLQSPGLRFLKNIAQANQLPTNDQTDSALCASITGRRFGNRLVKGKPYKAKDGSTKQGLEFGRNVTPAGMIPAKVDDAPLTNGAAGTPTTSPALAGASFASE